MRKPYQVAFKNFGYGAETPSKSEDDDWAAISKAIATTGQAASNIITSVGNAQAQYKLAKYGVTTTQYGSPGSVGGTVRESSSAGGLSFGSTKTILMVAGAGVVLLGVILFLKRKS